MKKQLTLIFIIAICLAGFSSCKKAAEALFPGVDFTLPVINVTVPAIPLADSTAEVGAGSFTTYVNVDSTIKANTNGIFGINAVSSVKVKQVAVTASNADADNNLSAFKTFRITIASNDKTTASDMMSISFPADAGASYTEQPANSTNIVDYLHGTSITNAVYGSARKTTTKALNIQMTITLTAK